MNKIFIIVLLFMPMSVFCKENNSPIIMGDNFHKMTKKREVTQSEKEKQHYKNEYNKFSNALIKELHRQITTQLYGITKDFNPGDENTAVRAGDYFIAHAYAINLAMLNGEFTSASVNKVINFWKSKGVYNPNFWIEVCQNVGEKDVISNKREITRAQKNGTAKGLVLKEYPFWKCNFKKGQSKLIYDF